jgi:hypothetical protein
MQHGDADSAEDSGGRLKRKNSDLYSQDMKASLVPPQREGDSIRSVFGMYLGEAPDKNGSRKLLLTCSVSS